MKMCNGDNVGASSGVNDGGVPLMENLLAGHLVMHVSLVIAMR